MINNKKIDFYSLDLHKYLEWLLNRYALYSSIQTLPFIVDIKNNYLVRFHRLKLHYKATRNKELPENIAKAYNLKIVHFQKQENEYKELIHSLISFNCAIYETGNYPKKYGFFDKKELLKVEINTYWINKQLKEPTQLITDFINDLNTETQRTPLKKEQFYIKKLKELKKYNFTYLDAIINAQFIYNLNETKQLYEFIFDIEQILKIQHIENKIKGKQPTHEPTKQIQWTGTKNILPTILNEFLENGMLKGSKENIARLFNCNFIDIDNKPFSTSSIMDIMNPTKNAKSSKTVEHIENLIKDIKNK
jgi:hypothetical protein